MTIWAIGDLHGCGHEFEALLEAIDFVPGRDHLWVTGDLINRGPQSLETLRRVYELREHASVVLGNHDLHLLAVAFGHARLKPSDTLTDILEAPDREVLLEWLRCQPLMVESQTHQCVMTHAGLLPQWSIERARQYAREGEAMLSSRQFFEFLPHMYGNEPAYFEPTLRGHDRLRAIINVFTRMRFIDEHGRLDFSAKEGLDSAPEGFRPWFCFERGDTERLIFGHWAALEGRTPGALANVRSLDAGCVWGGALMAMNLETDQIVTVAARPRQ